MEKEVMIPKAMVNELVVEAVEDGIKKQRPIVKIEGELDFEPMQVVATDHIPEVLEQNWLECLPKWREFCKIRIVGNSIVITPVDITDVP